MKRFAVLGVSLVGLCVLLAVYLEQSGNGIPTTADGDQPDWRVGSPRLEAAPSGRTHPTPDDAPQDAPAEALRLVSDASEFATVQKQIGDLARQVCADPTKLASLVETAMDLAQDRRRYRAAAALIVAVGRCGDERVLRDLCRLMETGAVRRALGGPLVVALGQRREADLHQRDGPGIGVGDTWLDCPVQEAYVRSSILEGLQDCIARKEKGEFRSRAMTVLGISAALDEGLFLELRRMAQADKSLLSLLLLGLRVSGGSATIDEFIESLLADKSTDENSLTLALACMLRTNPTRGVAFARAVLSAENDAVRKLWIVGAMANIAAYAGDDLRPLEEFCVLASEWSESAQGVVVQGPRDAGPEGRVGQGRVVGTNPAVLSLLRSLVSVRGRSSRVFRELLAKHFLRFVRDDPSATSTQVKRIVADAVDGGGRTSGEEILRQLVNEEVRADLLVAVLEACRSKITNRAEWDDIERLVESVTLKLPPDLREALRRDPRGG